VPAFPAAFAANATGAEGPFDRVRAAAAAGAHAELLAANSPRAELDRTRFAEAEGPTASATAVEQPEEPLATHVDATGPSFSG
jgi:hypothetical protein